MARPYDAVPRSRARGYSLVRSSRTACPIRENGISVNEPRTGIALPSVAVDVPAGQTLFLTVASISDMSAGFGSRVVGAMRLRDVEVHLPVTTR